MAKSWKSIETWLALVAVAVGTVIAAVFGLHVYVTSTAEQLHPDPQRVPSAALAEPAPAWTSAVAKARPAVRAVVSTQNLPGVAVAVGVGDALVWAEGFGWADLARRAPVTATTPFRIGTLSIPLTSAAAGRLLEQERLSLDAPIQSAVPGMPATRWPVTLRQVMGHVGGVRSDGGDEGPLFSEHCERPVEALPHIDAASLRFEPGTQYQYSRYGWILVSAAIEEAAGDAFLRVMRDEVFTPIGMADTRADTHVEAEAGRVSGRATSYFPRYSADPRYGADLMRDLDFSCYAGSSVFISTAPDLVRFGQAITRGALLRSDTVRTLQTSQRLRDGNETGYGLGWDRETVTIAGRPTAVVGHDGDLLGGIVSSLLIVPEQELVVVVLANISYADTAGIASAVGDAFTSR